MWQRARAHITEKQQKQEVNRSSWGHRAVWSHPALCPPGHQLARGLQSVYRWRQVPSAWARAACLALPFTPNFHFLCCSAPQESFPYLFSEMCLLFYPKAPSHQTRKPDSIRWFLPRPLLICDAGSVVWSPVSSCCPNSWPRPLASRTLDARRSPAHWPLLCLFHLLALPPRSGVPGAQPPPPTSLAVLGGSRPAPRFKIPSLVLRMPIGLQPRTLSCSSVS